MDISQGEKVEKELAVSLTKADKKRRKLEGERSPEPSYMPGLRRRDAALQQANAWEWLRHHRRQLDAHTRTSSLITAHHEQEIAMYERMLGIDHEGDSAA